MSCLRLVEFYLRHAAFKDCYKNTSDATLDTFPNFISACIKIEKQIQIKLLCPKAPMPR